MFGEGRTLKHFDVLILKKINPMDQFATLSDSQASPLIRKQEKASYSPFLMNIDSLVNNAFFLSTSQRNPYKLASTKRKNEVTTTRQDLNVVAK